MSLFFYLFTLAINLWHRKFVTADVTAVIVNNQHEFSDNNKILIKKHINTLSIHNYTRTGIKIDTLKMHFLLYLLNICIKFEFLIPRVSVATCIW